MKKCILIFLFLLTFLVGYGQTTFECITCERLSRDNCSACQEYGATSEYFSGLIVRKSGRITWLHKPYQVFTKGNTVTLRDWKGNEAVVNLRETNYSTMFQMMLDITSCLCDANGLSYSDSLIVFVTPSQLEDSLANVSGIDSTFVQNDSVFIASGGDEYFSGISVPFSNDGRILYVSKNGNNSTAEVGNYFKPFLTIQGAITAATDNDFIVIYPGVYTENTNLGTKKLNYYFFTKSQCTGCKVLGANDVNISGKGTFINLLDNTPFGPTSGANYSIEADSIYTVFCTQAFNGNMVFKARAWRVSSINGFINSSNADSINNRSVIVDVDYLWAGTLIFNIPNRFIEINVKKFFWNGISGTGEIISNWQANWNSATFRLNATEIIDATQTNVPTRIMYLDAPSNRSFNDAHIEFNIGKFETNDFLWEYVNYGGTNNKNAYISINCQDCIYTDTLSFFWKKTSTLPRSLNFPIIIEGNYTVSRGSFFDVVDGTTNQWNAELKFQNFNLNNKSASKEPFRFETIGANKVFFKNSTIIAGLTSLAPVTANTVSQNIYIMNTFTNSITINANVTENIQPFIRNTNVK